MTEKVWSVELAVQNFEDDTFNGNYEECQAWVKEHEYENDKYQLALVVIDEDGLVLDTLDVEKYNF